MGVSLASIQKAIHEMAKEKGWWEEERGFAEVIALAHSELSEALEEYRDGKGMLYYNEDNPNKPEGIGIEMADVIIRILDWAEHADVDIEEMIRLKFNYNATRPYKHGGKKI